MPWRLAQLSPAALALAELTAASGRPCHYAVLARAYDGDEAALVQALDELWRRRLLRETGGDSYDFTHEKLREVCYEGMSAARRRLAHHRVSEALAAGQKRYCAASSSSRNASAGAV
jgi:predicted ATPase